MRLLWSYCALVGILLALFVVIDTLSVLLFRSLLMFKVLEGEASLFNFLWLYGMRRRGGSCCLCSLWNPPKVRLFYFFL